MFLRTHMLVASTVAQLGVTPVRVREDEIECHKRHPRAVLQVGPVLVLVDPVLVLVDRGQVVQVLVLVDPVLVLVDRGQVVQADPADPARELAVQAARQARPRTFVPKTAQS
jgi:hypothetical protein